MWSIDYLRHRIAHFIRPVVDFEAKLDPKEFGGGRIGGPYMTGEIGQFMCSRKGCGRRSHASWAGCADGNVQRPLCPEHDAQLNLIAMIWWGDPNVDQKMNDYITSMEQEIGRTLDSSVVYA